MTKLYTPLDWKYGFVQLKNTIIFSNNADEHFEHIKKILYIHYSNEVYINHAESQFFTQTKNYLSRTKDNEELNISSEKITAIG